MFMKTKVIVSLSNQVKRLLNNREKKIKEDIFGQSLLIDGDVACAVS